MTVAASDLITYDDYPLSGVSDYPISFQFYNEADIVVWYRSGTSGAWAKWALITNYTITNHTEDTLSDGTVTVVDTGVTGYIVITREVSPLQGVNWDSYSSLNLPLLEIAVDRLSHMLSDLKRRVLQLPYGFAENAENLLPAASARGILGWNSSEALATIAILPAATNGKVLGWSAGVLANLDAGSGTGTGTGTSTNSNIVYFDGLIGVTSTSLDRYTDPNLNAQYVAIGITDGQNRLYVWETASTATVDYDQVLIPDGWVGAGRWILYGHSRLFHFSGLTGGTTDSQGLKTLDAVTGYAEGAMAIGFFGVLKYSYQYDSTHVLGATSAPDYVVPADNSSGTGAWILRDVVNRVTLTATREIFDSAGVTLEELDPTTGLRTLGMKSTLLSAGRIEVATVDSGDVAGTVLRIDTDGHLETWSSGTKPAYIALGNGYVTPIASGPLVGGFTGLTPPNSVYPSTGGSLAYSDNGEDSIGTVRSATEILFSESGAVSSGVSSGSYNAPVAASADDAEENVSSGAMFLGSTELNIVDYLLIGLRFTNVTIPQGATITAAYLAVTSSNNSTSSVTVANIYGEDADNSAQFTSTTSDISNRTSTTASVTWTTIAAWTQNTEYQSDSIISIIQEIVDRASWVSGNALSIMADWTSGGTKQFYAQDDTVGDPVSLYVTYTY